MADQDWFAQNAPQAQAPAADQGDWFDQNKPGGQVSQQGAPRSTPTAGQQVAKSLKNTWQGVTQPIGAAAGAIGGDPQQAMDIGNSMVDASANHLHMARQAASEGNWGHAVSHFLAATPVLGPWAYDEVGKFFTPGQRVEGATDLATVGLMGGIGKGIGQLSDAVKAGKAKGMANATAKAQQSARPQVTPQMAPTEAPDFLGKVQAGVAGATEHKVLGKAVKQATQGLAPGASEPFEQDLQVALPIVAKEATATPYPGSTRTNPIGRPIGAPYNKLGSTGQGPLSNVYYRPEDITQLKDVKGATEDALGRKGDQWQYLLQQAQEAGYKVPAARIRQSVMDSFGPEMKARYAPTMASIQAELNRLYPDGQWFDPNDLNRKRTELTAQLRSIMNQPAGAQVAGERAIPQDVQLKAEKQAVNEPLYLFTGDTGRQVMREYGALLSLSDAIDYRINPSIAYEGGGVANAVPYVARASAQAGLAESRGAISNFSTGLAKWAMPKPGPGGLLRKAFENVGVEPAPVNQEYHLPGMFPGQKQLGAGAGEGGALQRQPFTMPPGGGGMGVRFTGQMGPGAPPGELPPVRIPPQRQLPAASSSGGPAIPMPGGQAPIVPPPPPFPQGLLGPDSSGPIPPVLPQGYVPPNLPPPPTAARGASVMGIAKPPKIPAAPKGPTAEVRREKVRNTFRGAKQRLDRQFMGMAKGNKIGSYGVPPGVLTDQQSTQYNGAVRDLLAQQNNELMQIPDDAPNGPIAPAGAPMPPGVVPIPAAGGVTVNGPSPVIVGEPGPERIDHSDGRPPDMVSGTQVVNLGENGSTDKVTPLVPFPEKGIIRGSANIPLSPEGQMQAQKLGQQLAKAGGMDKVYSSDLSRTQETAQHIAQATGAQIMPPTPGLRSWALGYLEGQPGSDGTDQIIAHHINAVPDEPVPGQGPVSTQPGESFNQFKGRVIPTVQAIMQEQATNPQTRVNIVTHNRDEKLIRAWLAAGGGRDLDKRVFDEDGGEPGSMSRIAQVAPGRYRVEDFDPGKQPTLPGVYLTRHSATGWNSQKGAGGS